MLRLFANALVLSFMIVVLPACENEVTGPDWIPIPGASIDPSAVTMGEGDEIEFSLVDAPPGNYTWILGNTRDNAETIRRIDDGKYILTIVKVLRPGAVLDLEATPDGGRSRITSLITLK